MDTAYLRISSLFEGKVVIYDGFILITIGEITLLRIPEMSSSIVCERSCLDVDDLSHSAAADKFQYSSYYRMLLQLASVLLRNCIRLS
jgi:hypothetical protein